MSSRLMLFISALLLSAPAFSWGGRGHHTICDAAVYLVKEKGLRDYLQAKPHIMGYLCNIPDIYWRDLGPEVSKFGDATHYVDVELLGSSPKDIPLDYKKIIADMTGKPNPFKPGGTINSVPNELGSNWWRADQFYRRAISPADAWKTTAAPANPKEERDDNLAFNKMAYDFMVNLGLMGHFVGDNGQPFHSTVDYDGYLKGHGGIHAYFEENLVAVQGPQLLTKVVDKGNQYRKSESKYAFLNEKSILARMRALAIEANQEIPKVFAMDKVKTPSTQKNEKGMSLRTPAEREPAEKMGPRFESLIVNDMARSAALLAQIWDEAYVQVGRPKLAAHKSYRFPRQPEFVVPDYFEAKDIGKEE